MNDDKKTIDKPENYFFRASAKDFSKIPGSPIAYWISAKAREAFSKSSSITEIAPAKQGLATADNNRFVRQWSEISFKKIKLGCSSIEEASKSNFKWFPYNKGGEYRRWYGNQDFIVNWQNDGEEIKGFVDNNGKQRSRPQNTQCYFIQSLSWSDITSGNTSFRYFPEGFIYDVTGMSAQPNECDMNRVLAFINTKIITWFVKALNPTLHFQIGNFSALPYLSEAFKEDSYNVEFLLDISKSDWNAYETSWDFSKNPLLREDIKTANIADSYEKLFTENSANIVKMKELEEENNRIFIDAYGLQDELTPVVPLNEITLTCNPYYRYGVKVRGLGFGIGDSGEGVGNSGFGIGNSELVEVQWNKTKEELDTRMLADTMKEFISYSVGCMLGRYSLDKDGLILANQGEDIGDLELGIRKENTTPNCQSLIPSSKHFLPDDDNIIPILDDEYFTDDIVGQFKDFLKVSFGDGNYQDNWRFIEDAIGKDIRKYFLKDFYPEHIKRYKKRPIYWQFSSPQKSFNVLIYMHRYRSDTVSQIRNNYLLEFIEKLSARKENQKQITISEGSNASDKSKANKEIDRINKVVKELEDYDREVLYPLATQKIEIDLDDGVKQNYPKFGKALAKVAGLG